MTMDLPPEPDDSPVFILTASRSGSTLLRIILDSHPRLACPPETSITGACLALAMTCDALENAGVDSATTDKSGRLPPVIATTVRTAADRAYGHYLAQRGKERWCDKSLDSFMHAELMAQVYPEAKFICLFRHCMDVVASAVEACPWGLRGYGLDPFVTQYPGNSVAAVSSYWLACAQAVLSFSDAHPGSCHLVRYEDLVTTPEETAAGILSFLGEQPVPGITQACFDTPHEVNGPADGKIWFTSEVTAASMGRGTTVSAGSLPEPIRAGVNQVLGRLGYRPVDDRWNDAAIGTDPRVSPPAPRIAATDVPARRGIETATALITDRIRSRPSDKLREIAECWPALVGQTIGIVVEDTGLGRAELRHTFPPASPHEAADPATVATITASSDTWQSLLAGSSNVFTEQSAGRIRWVGGVDDHGHSACSQGQALRAVSALLGISKIPAATAAPSR